MDEKNAVWPNERIQSHLYADCNRVDEWEWVPCHPRDIWSRWKPTTTVYLFLMLVNPMQIHICTMSVH